MKKKYLNRAFPTRKNHEISMLYNEDEYIQVKGNV